MAAPVAEEPLANTTRFPAPPVFWQSFTPENLEKINILRKFQDPVAFREDAAIALPVKILELPSELRSLQPPEPPADGRWQCFGETFYLTDPLPTLEEQNVRQLYTPPSTPNGSSTGKNKDRAFILKKIAKSLLLKFLELTGVMSVNPEENNILLEDLKTLFFNFHQLLNEYRPHQARESIIMMMQDQLEKSKAETQGILQQKRKVEGVLEGLGSAMLAENTNDTGKQMEEKEEGLEVWEELESEFY